MLLKSFFALRTCIFTSLSLPFIPNWIIRKITRRCNTMTSSGDHVIWRHILVIQFYLLLAFWKYHFWEKTFSDVSKITHGHIQTSKMEHFEKKSNDFCSLTIFGKRFKTFDRLLNTPLISWRLRTYWLTIATSKFKRSELETLVGRCGVKIILDIRIIIYTNSVVFVCFEKKACH